MDHGERDQRGGDDNGGVVTVEVGLVRNGYGIPPEHHSTVIVSPMS